MKYNILTINPFERQLKRLVRKYPSLKKEYAQLIAKLETEPTQVLPCPIVASRSVSP
jgi:hypothetical protein